MRISILFAVTAFAVSCQSANSNSSVKDGPPPGAVGMPLPQTTTLVSITDAAAKDMYQQLNWEAVSLGNSKVKSSTGKFAIYCSKAFGGMPSGAQGMPGAPEVNCGISPYAEMPPGMQGLPAPVLVTLGGTNAAAFYNGFNVEEEQFEDANRKSARGLFHVRCTKVTSSHTCKILNANVNDEGGGIPDGAQGLPIEEGDGGMPDGAQGLPIPAE